MKNLAHEVRSDGSHHMSVNSSMASLYLVHMSEAHQAAIYRVEDHVGGVGECFGGISEVRRRREIRRIVLDRTKVNYANFLRGICRNADCPVNRKSYQLKNDRQKLLGTLNFLPEMPHAVHVALTDKSQSVSLAHDFECLICFERNRAIKLA